MDGNHLNVTRGLVRLILALTDEQRRSNKFDSNCQTIFCHFGSIESFDSNVTCRTFAKKLSEHSIDRIFLWKSIFLYLYPILIFIGILGNSSAALIMFLNVRRSGYPSNFYLSLLAFVDCLFLLGSAIPDWFSYLDDQWDIRLISDFFCRFVYWFGNFTTHLSAGLVVSVTVERFLAIRYPLLAHRASSVTNTHRVLLILILFFFVLDSRVFLLVQHLHENIHIVQICANETEIEYARHDTFACGIPRRHQKTFWVWIDFAVYTLIPFLIIVTFNLLIIRRLILAQRLREKMNESMENRRTQSLSSTPRPSTPSRRRPRQSLKRCHSASMTHQNNLRLTILLLLISCSYLLLTLPAVVMNLILALKWKTSPVSFHHPINHSDRDDLNYNLARLLMVINHSITFILYFLLGKRFRQDLKRLLFHCCSSSR